MDCKVAWSHLSAKDVETLEREDAHCLGREERWHTCEVRTGVWCRGAEGHEDCKPIPRPGEAGYNRYTDS